MVSNHREGRDGSTKRMEEVRAGANDYPAALFRGQPQNEKRLGGP